MTFFRFHFRFYEYNTHPSFLVLVLNEGPDKILDESPDKILRNPDLENSRRFLTQYRRIQVERSWMKVLKDPEKS